MASQSDKIKIEVTTMLGMLHLNLTGLLVLDKNLYLFLKSM